MKIAVYGDTHLTKNMKTMQYQWDESAKKSINSMYDHYDSLGVELAVCLGDFFDAPRIEAKNMTLVLPILESINSRTYPTYILLGNHEADSEETNILEFLSTYENIYPVTRVTDIENMLFIPYNVDPSVLYLKKDYIVFTHHDIYGSELAAGKTKSFFGIDPSIFNEVRLVMNGHVHLKSRVTKNVYNAGSLLVSQQGEVKLGDYPSYYIIDTNTLDISEFHNKYSMIYLTIDEEEVPRVLEAEYDKESLVLKIEYENEIPLHLVEEEFSHYTWRKKISSIGEKDMSIIQAKSFDMKNYLVDFIKKDKDLLDTDREEYIDTGLKLLDNM